MNSLEKLIQDLKDSKLIVNDEIKEYRDEAGDSGMWDYSIQTLNFVNNAIQGAINRLEALNEELRVGE